MKLYSPHRAWSLALLSLGLGVVSTQASAWYSAPHQWRPAAAPVSAQKASYHRAANLPAFRPARTPASGDRFARAQPKRLAPARSASRYAIHRPSPMRPPMPPVRQAMMPAPMSPFAGQTGMPFMQPMMARMWPPMRPQPQVWQPAPQRFSSVPQASRSVSTGHAVPPVEAANRATPSSRSGHWPANRMHSRWRPVQPPAIDAPRYGQRVPFGGSPDWRRQAGLGMGQRPAAPLAAPALMRPQPPATGLQWRPAATTSRVSYQAHDAFRPANYGRPALNAQPDLASTRASAHTRSLPGWVTTYQEVQRVDCEHCRGG